MITNSRREDKSTTACGCNRDEKMEKHSKKKLHITVGFKKMKNSLINYLKNYYLALNQYADRVRAARKYQSI